MTDEKKTTPAGLAEATVKFEHASSGLELFREEQKAWSELSFIREEDGEITDYWAVPEIRGVSKNDAYTAQCRLGSLYAFEVFDLIETFKSRVEGIGFSPVARSIVKRGQWTGFEIGFFSSVDEYITDGQIKVAGGVLARPEEDGPGLVQAPAKAASTAGRTTIQRLYQQALGVYEQIGKAADRGDGDADLICETFSELRDQIMDTPATCPQDVADKLRLFATMMDIVNRPETLPEMGDNAEGYLRIAICDLERLGRGILTGADASLEKLAADYHAASEAGDHAQDALDAARQPDAPVSLAESGEMAIRDRMLGIDAEGLRGVRAKVQAMFAPWAWERFKGPDTSMFDPLIDQDMLRSVVVDLERLSGGARS